jgi:hypothetical protein
MFLDPGSLFLPSPRTPLIVRIRNVIETVMIWGLPSFKKWLTFLKISETQCRLWRRMIVLSFAHTVPPIGAVIADPMALFPADTTWRQTQFNRQKASVYGGKFVHKVILWIRPRTEYHGKEIGKLIAFKIWRKKLRYSSLWQLSDCDKFLFSKPMQIVVQC